MAAVTVQSAPLRAQVERAPVIGVIDIQGVLRASTAVQALSREVEARRDRTQAEMQGREEALRAADSDLVQRRSALTPHAYAEERAKLEADPEAWQREAQELRRRLDLRFTQGLSQNHQILFPVSHYIDRDNDIHIDLAKTHFR